jgi:hypothetical protein
LKEYPDRQIEQICADCRLLPTKPGREPAHLSWAIYIANELDEDSLVCEGFDYPAILDFLDPFEWVCLIAIKAARRASESKSVKAQQDGMSQKTDITHLRDVVHGHQHG